MIDFIYTNPDRFIVWVLSIVLLSLALALLLYARYAETIKPDESETPLDEPNFSSSNVIDFTPKNIESLKNKAIHDFIQMEIELENQNIKEYLRRKKSAKLNAKKAGFEVESLATKSK